jgi:hypothetical protein
MLFATDALLADFHEDPFVSSAYNSSTSLPGSTGHLPGPMDPPGGKHELVVTVPKASVVHQDCNQEDPPGGKHELFVSVPKASVEHQAFKEACKKENPPSGKHELVVTVPKASDKGFPKKEGRPQPKNKKQRTLERAVDRVCELEPSDCTDYWDPDVENARSAFQGFHNAAEATGFDTRALMAGYLAECKGNGISADFVSDIVREFCVRCNIGSFSVSAVKW